MAGYGPGAVSYARKEESASKGHEPIVAKVPYRTRRGINIIIAVIIAIICAVVGGVVGGTHHSSKPQSDTASQQNSGSGSTTTQGEESNGLGRLGDAPTPSSSINAASPTTTTTATAYTNDLPPGTQSSIR